MNISWESKMIVPSIFYYGHKLYSQFFKSLVSFDISCWPGTKMNQSLGCLIPILDCRSKTINKIYATITTRSLAYGLIKRTRIV